MAIPMALAKALKEDHFALMASLDLSAVYNVVNNVNMFRMK